MSDFIGPYECVELAAESAGIKLTPLQIHAMSETLVDLGADFNVQEDEDA